MNYFVHPLGLAESTNIGPNTRIWAYTHILPRAKIGNDCNICDHVFIENDVVIGHRVTIKSGVQLWDGIEIGDDVFIGPNVTFTNDIFPRSKQYPETFFRTTIGPGASIGANATILPGVIIGRNAMIGAGTVVTSSVPANAVVVGNPGKIKKFLNTSDEAGIKDSLIRGCHTYSLPANSDSRGSLSFGEFEKNIPMVPKRYFLIFNVKPGEYRGNHSHKTCEQFFICTQGSCSIALDNGQERISVTLDSPSKGLYVKAGTWVVVYNFEISTSLLVFTSDYYDATDYIHNYEEFLTHTTL